MAGAYINHQQIKKHRHNSKKVWNFDLIPERIKSSDWSVKKKLSLIILILIKKAKFVNYKYFATLRSTCSSDSINNKLTMIQFMTSIYNWLDKLWRSERDTWLQNDQGLLAPQIMRNSRTLPGIKRPSCSFLVHYCCSSSCRASRH